MSTPSSLEACGSNILEPTSVMRGTSLQTHSPSKQLAGAAGCRDCFLHMDLSWLAAELTAAREGSLPLQADRGLVWNPDWGQGQTDLRGDELIPTVTVEAQRSAGVQYRTKVLTVNIQGYKDKIKYLEQQLPRRGCQLAICSRKPSVVRAL